MDNRQTSLGKTRDEWYEVIEITNAHIELLERAREEARVAADIDKLKSLEEKLSIMRGTLIAAKEVLMNPPFSENPDEKI